MPLLLVIGASRGIGLETVKAALRAGHNVRAFSRSAQNIAVEDSKLEKYTGDALNPEDIKKALQGIDVVIQTIGLATGSAYLSGTDFFSKSTRILIDQMEQHGPKRMISVTGLGAGDSRGHGGFVFDTILFPVILKRIYDDKDIQEQMIKNSKLDWTIARPGILRDGAATGLVRALTNTDDWTAGDIRRADVAEFLINEAKTNTYLRQTPLLIE